jgi:DNA helicase-2/ATP-dependent DNA helicase PcrA
MTIESWSMGPPGTGKTTHLSRLIQDAVQEYGSDGVLVSSFTKAAAVELAGRGLPIDSERVGTLHSICYRALGYPDLAESHIAEFNEENKQHALFRVGVDRDDPAWEIDGQTPKDDYFAAYQAQRTRMIPVMSMTFNGTYDQSFIDWVDAWRNWKRENDYLDFCDLLDRALYELDGSPLDASILFVDEAQDCGPLHMAVARKWAAGMEKLVLAFDDDQSLYDWMGADPKTIFSHEPDEKIVLSQSYRVPRAVHALADRFVHTRLDLDYRTPSAIATLTREYVEDGKSVMILASCGFMLKGTIAALKAKGLPFHNPMKPRRTEWNPLDPGSGRRLTPLRRVQSYLRVRPDVFGIDAKEWDAEQFKAWALHVRADDLFKRGTKTLMASKEFAYRGHAALLQDGADFDGALAGDLDWLDERLQGETGDRMRYPLKIAQELGPKALLEKPRITVGTIHSVKGGESDVVIVMPDLSSLGRDEYAAEGPRRDSVIRMIYVALTRAREGLVLCGQAGPSYVPMWQ